MRARPSDRHRLRPALVELEGRRLLLTITVTSLADTMTGGVPTTGTLRWAVEQANAATGASTIDFDLTVFAAPQTITLMQGQLELSNTCKAETIAGPAAGVTIGAGGLSRVFQVDSGVTATLSGLTITGGNPVKSKGGGLYNEGTTTLTDCTISANTAASGGGLATTGTSLPHPSTLTLAGCTISGNSADSGGGVYTGDYVFTDNVSDCTISENSASSVGGGLSDVNGGDETLTDCIISGNSAGDLGGGLYSFAEGDELNDCTISGNTAGGHGGGLDSGGGGFYLYSSTISGNSAEYGGGLENDEFGYLTNCTISGNSAEFVGGLNNSAKAFPTLNQLTVVACTISGNSTGNDAGGLYNGGTATLTDTIVAANTGPGGTDSEIAIARRSGHTEPSRLGQL